MLYNGWLDGSYTTLGAKVIFRCNDNMLYEGHPEQQAVCQRDGTWSHALPRCFGMYACGRLAPSRMMLAAACCISAKDSLRLASRFCMTYIITFA